MRTFSLVARLSSLPLLGVLLRLPVGKAKDDLLDTGNESAPL
jgi:hypothetical protein